MAKRLTDTEKWKDDWYVALSNDNKAVWQWLVDNCSHAGFCKRSISFLNIMCKTSISEEEMLLIMSGRVVIHRNEWFIPGFIKFQYTTLFSKKPVILSVVKELFQKQATKMIPESFGNDYIIISESFDNHYLMIKDKEKDKSKDNVFSVTQNKNNGNQFSNNFAAQREQVLVSRATEGLRKVEQNRTTNTGS